MMRDALFLSLRYLRWSPWRTGILLLGTTVAAFLPIFTWTATAVLEEGLLRRARDSPILVGYKGNEFDLTMSSLYFRGQVSDHVEAGEARELAAAGIGAVVPLYVEHTAGGSPIVGTDVEYFPVRGLVPAAGRLPALLGEIVAGASLAQNLKLEVGDTLQSDQRNLYNIAGSTPLLLTVVGILGPNGTPDDDAFFADVRTAWTLEGLLHGHDQVSASRNAEEDPENTPEAENIEASAAIFMFQKIDDSNRSSFHAHGSPDDAPLTSILVVPRDQRAHDLLLGDYALDEDLQAVRPIEVVRTVLGIVIRARDALAAYFAVVAASTTAFFALVISLTLRLRRRELDLMRRIGSSPATIGMVVTSEIVIVLAASVALASATAWGAIAVVESQLGL
ncbi:MAG: ABC transporter permease [Acidobacteriota bacterium]|nr:ABC transporter permease [Acidobacteriota bacterium]